MVTCTARVSDEKHNRMRRLAQRSGTTRNRLIDEMTTTMILAQHGVHYAQTGSGFALRGANEKDCGVELLAKAAK